MLTDLDHMVLLKDLTEQEQMQFMVQYNMEKKEPVHGVLFAAFLGGFGAHQFYMGRVGVGILYILFIWTLIPPIIAFVEVFLMSGRVKRYNAEKTREIVTAILAFRN